MAETKYIIFLLGDQKFSMKLAKINGIEYIYNVVPVPMGSDCIKGIIHLRNNIVPIYNLKGQFGIDIDAENANPQMLICETRGMKMGIEVDDVLGIIPVPEEDIKKVPNLCRNDDTGYLENIIKVTLPETGETDIMIAVNVDKLMSDNEFDSVQEALEKSTDE
ncbi:MAG: hypothetical protein E7258_02225 [Lachnospiraceae bacterium]|nr:hypothetical protein [Lachnospiraceae bacterium]